MDTQSPLTPPCGCGACAGAADAPAISVVAPPRRRPKEHALLDRFFLHPRFGFVGSMLVFAGVLFVVFEVSTWIDSMTTARLAAWASEWQPATTPEVVLKAVADGLIGLAGIVVPYMIPLVLLLVALEQAGLMQRIAIVIDRAFHRIGLHGATAVSFLTGLGCNVPAISSAARFAQGRERVIASLLITFVPCSARSAIILALAGKWLGGAGVFAIFASTLVTIALLGRLLSKRRPALDPARAHAVPPYAMPRWKPLLKETWLRTQDVLTIVMPLLVVGSVALALLQHWGADVVINAALKPVTTWWLGLPAVLGVPLLFGILRKELSLVMVFQALGTFEVGAVLDAVQLTTLLLFITFYIPCLATFAVMIKTIGKRSAIQSVALSIGAALVVSGIARVAMLGAAALFA